MLHRGQILNCKIYQETFPGNAEFNPALRRAGSSQELWLCLVEEQKPGGGFTRESCLDFPGKRVRAGLCCHPSDISVAAQCLTQSPSNPSPAQAVLISRNIEKGNKSEQAQHTLPAACSFHTLNQMLPFSCSLKPHAGPFLQISLITAG